MNLLPIVMATFALSVLLQADLKRRAWALGLVDVPLGRKLHAAVTPVTGGLATFAAFGSASLLAGPGAGVTLALLMGLALLVGCGMIDDLIHLPAGLKLAAQFAAALIVLAPGGALLRSTGNLPFVGDLDLGLMAWPISVLLSVGLVNAFNMLDGLDGLAGGTGLIALAWLSVVAAATGAGDAILGLIGVALAALSGFLIFNLRHPWRERATIFLGDAGSMLIGGLMAWLALRLMSGGAAPVPLVVVLWVLVLPICDCGSVVIRRVRRGANPMRADRTHLHHFLRDAGLPVEQTVALILLASVAAGGVGVLGWLSGVPTERLTLGLVIPVALHTVTVLMLGRLRVGRGTPPAPLLGGPSLP